jgi:ubiquinol-cytochrome c reductase cytochrome b subunit
LLLGPVLGFSVTRRVCIALQRKDREVVLHGYETGRIVRLPGGEYFEVQQPVDRYERWRLAGQPRPEPAPVRLDVAGRIRPVERLRGALSRWFFEDRIAPLDPQPGRSPDRPHRDNRKTTVSV